MAEGSRDQGGVSTADPEEDSPNMIVYRKVRPTLPQHYKKDPCGIELGCVFPPPPPGGASVSPPVLLTSPPSLSMRVCLTRGPISVEGDRPVSAGQRLIFWDGVPTGEMLVISPISPPPLPHPSPAQLTDGVLSLRQRFDSLFGNKYITHLLIRP